MKTVKFTHFIHKYGTVLKNLNEGIMITKDNKPYLMLTKPEQKDIKESRKVVDAQAERAVKEYLQIDSFTKIKPPKPQMLGRCSLCGRQGPVIRKKHINQFGIMVGGFLCGQCTIPDKVCGKIVVKYNEKISGTDMNTNYVKSDLNVDKTVVSTPKPGNVNPDSNPEKLTDFGGSHGKSTF